MQESHQDGRRIRNVPIRMEGDMNESARYNTEPRRWHREQNYGTQGRDEYEPQGYQHQTYAHGPLNEPDQFDQRRSPHTSSININYRPQPSSHREHQQQQQKFNDQYGTHNVSSEEPTRSAEISSRLNAQQQSHQEQQTDRHDCPDKENAFNSSNECTVPRTDDGKSEEQKPSPIPPPVIPLPPPPSHVEPAKDGQADKHPQQGKQQSNEDQEEEEKDARAKRQGTGPLAVINATKAEVNRLLQEVAKCGETSTKSKEFLRLEELLTLCILKLDNIEAGSELRQQRKEVINMINKCTDILERKINLNNDIQQLAANCQQ